MSDPALFCADDACSGFRGAAAPPLVLLHGWGLHSGVWEGILPGLREHFRVIRIDLPGMGQSASFPGHADLDCLSTLVSKVLPDSCHLLGWSLGGLVAMRLAQRQPRRVLSLTTVAASPKFVAAHAWPGIPASTLEQFMCQLADDAAGALWRFLAMNCAGTSTARADLRVLRRIFRDSPQPSPSVLQDGLQMLMDVDLRHLLSECRAPLCMLFGDRDAIVPSNTCAALMPADVPNRYLKVLEDCAHIPFVSHPRSFLDELMGGWRQLGVLS